MSKKDKNAQNIERKVITRVNNYDDLLEQKMYDLGIDNIVLRPKGEDKILPLIYEENRVRTVLKLELGMPNTMMSDEDIQVYFDDISSLLDNQSLTIRFVNKQIDMSNYTLGVENQKIEPKTEILKEFNRNEANEVNTMPPHQEYYLELFAENDNKLIKNANLEKKLLTDVNILLAKSNALHLFRVNYITKNEFEYLIEEAIIGYVNCIYHSNYITVNPGTDYEYYSKFLVIDDFGKDQMLKYWQNIIGMGFDTCINFHSYSLSESKEIMSNAITEKKFEFKGSDDGDRQEWLQDKQQLDDLNMYVRSQQDKICDVRFIVKIEEKTLEELEYKIDLFKNECGENFICHEYIGAMEELDSAYSGLQTKILGSKTMSFNAFVYGSGFYSSSYIEQYGYPYCTDPSTNNVFIFNRRKRKPKIGYDNYNAIFFGSTGSGKSATQKMFLMEDYLNGDYIIAIDFAHEYSNITKQLKGTYVNTNSSTVHMNPFELITKEETKDVDDLVNNIDYKRLYEFIQILIPTINAKYSDVEFTPIFRSFVEQAHEQYPEETMCFELLKRYLVENQIVAQEETREEYVINIITKICDEESIFSKPTNIDMTKRLIAFNIQERSADTTFVCALSYLIVNLTLKLMYQNKLDIVSTTKEGQLTELIEYAESKGYDIEDEINIGYQELSKVDSHNIEEFKRVLDDFVENVEDKIQQYGIKIRLYIDECHNILKPSQPIMVDSVDKIAREGRKYNAGLVLATQGLDVFESEDTLKIFQNIPMMLFLKVKPSALDRLSSVTNVELTNYQKSWLTSTNPGEGICFIGQNKFLMKKFINKKLLSMLGGGR